MRCNGCNTDDGFNVRWDLGEPFGELFDLTLSYVDLATGAVTWLPVTRLRGYWELIDVYKFTHQLNELMTRGLYRLGFEDENVLSTLPRLSEHEKLELRLSSPREFWPQKWIEEAG